MTKLLAAWPDHGLGLIIAVDDEGVVWSTRIQTHFLDPANHHFASNQWRRVPTVLP